MFVSRSNSNQTIIHCPSSNMAWLCSPVRNTSSTSTRVWELVECRDLTPRQQCAQYYATTQQTPTV